MLRLFLLLITGFSLVACSQIQVDEYRNLEPTLIPEVFFAGTLTAHGIIKNRSGKVTRRFNADIQASWNDGSGTLEEIFDFDNGETQNRTWTLTPTSTGEYLATAGDVVGDGTMSYSGNSIFLNYVLEVPYNDSTVNVRVDDRMYLVTPNILINESRMIKFGLEVGSIILVIIRQNG